MHRTVSTHTGVGAQNCCVQTPPGGVQMPQLSLQQTSPPWHTVLPQGTVSFGQSSVQWCGHRVPGAHVAHTTRQPLLNAARDILVPSTSPMPGSPDDPQPQNCDTRIIKAAERNARTVTIPSSESQRV